MKRRQSPERESTAASWARVDLKWLYDGQELELRLRYNRPGKAVEIESWSCVSGEGRPQKGCVQERVGAMSPAECLRKEGCFLKELRLDLVPSLKRERSEKAAFHNELRLD